MKHFIRNKHAFYLLLCVGLQTGLLGGCATLNKDECLNANWEAIGFKDGHDGYPQSRIDEHRKACAEYRIKPDLTVYLQGYERGIREFCKPQRAFQYGLRGHAYREVCPADMRRTFNEAYAEGRQLYELDRQIKKNQQAIQALDKEIHELDDAKAEIEARLIAGHIPRIERARLIEDMHVIDGKRAHDIELIKDYESDILRLQDERAHLYARSRYAR